MALLASSYATAVSADVLEHDALHIGIRCQDSVQEPHPWPPPALIEMYQAALREAEFACERSGTELLGDLFFSDRCQ